MQEGRTNKRSSLRHLAPILLLTAVTVGLLPAAAGAAEVRSAAESDRQAAPATTTGWSLVGTVDMQHIVAPNTQLIVYGAQYVHPWFAAFNPRVIPASAQQLVVPYVRIPDGDSHTYKLVFHLSTTSTTTTRFQLDNQTPVTAAGGDVTLEFTHTTAPTPGPSWYTWNLGNVNDDAWRFYSCDIYEQINQ